MPGCARLFFFSFNILGNIKKGVAFLVNLPHAYIDSCFCHVDCVRQGGEVGYCRETNWKRGESYCVSCKCAGRQHAAMDGNLGQYP